MTTPLIRRDELAALVWNRPLQEIGRAIGVSGADLAALIKWWRIPRPDAGYWTLVSMGRRTNAVMLPEADDLPLALNKAACLNAAKEYIAASKQASIEKYSRPKCSDDPGGLTGISRRLSFARLPARRQNTQRRQGRGPEARAASGLLSAKREEARVEAAEARLKRKADMAAAEMSSAISAREELLRASEERMIRHLKFISLASKGMTTASIADQLSISIKVAKRHLSVAIRSITYKTGLPPWVIARLCKPRRPGTPYNPTKASSKLYSSNAVTISRLLALDEWQQAAVSVSGACAEMQTTGILPVRLGKRRQS